jgi:2-polyprenyl-3-methyl-5-hydroxy-6-metoxy-1,4-benzoquinol methylase
MQDFNSDEGTMPQGKSAIRHRQRIGAILRQAIDAMDGDVMDISLLDIGCSSGSVLQIAQDIGIADVRGVEPAPKAAATAQKLGFDVFSGYLHDAHYPDNSFEIITMFEVIEHLPETASMAKEVYRLLRPGGLWLIGTANAESWTATNLREQWEYFSIAQNGGHISFFNPNSMKALARRYDFEVAYIQTKRVLHVPPQQRTALGKIKDEVMALPARITGNGHDMLVALRKHDE